MEDFSKNPCRHHLFEVFALDKSETDLRAVRAATQAARDRLHFGRIVARDGTEIQISESELNALEKELLTPVERLKVEQLVHQAHAFSRDPELARCIERLAGEDVDALPELLAEVQGQALLAVVRTTMPLLTPPPLADDLPWPPEPEGRAPRRETLEEAVLRDR
jgi:hypothetical protein